MPKGRKGGMFGGGRRALTLGRSPAPEAAPREEPESEEEAVEEASLAALAELGLDDDSSDDGEPEDLMGDQSWAKTDDFSGGMDSLFADMMGGQSVDEMRADLAAQGVDVDAELSGIGEEAAAEAAEAKRKAEEEAKAAAEEEKRKAAAARAEKRRNMTKEEKAAKIKANQYRKKAAAMHEEGTLVDTAQYEEGLRLVEEEDWLAAEAALKAATSSSEAPAPPLAQPEPEPEPEPEPRAGGVPPEPGSGQVASHDDGALEHEVAELRAKLDGLVAKKAALAGARRFREAGAAKKEVEAATLLLRQKEAALSQLHRVSQEKAAAETVAGHPAPGAEQTEADHGPEGMVAAAKANARALLASMGASEAPRGSVTAADVPAVKEEAGALLARLAAAEELTELTQLAELTQLSGSSSEDDGMDVDARGEERLLTELAELSESSSDEEPLVPDATEIEGQPELEPEPETQLTQSHSDPEVTVTPQPEPEVLATPRLAAAPRAPVAKYKVLHNATVREGKEKNSVKLGVYKKGMILDVVEESRNRKGLTVLRVSNPTGATAGRAGGWVKIKTSKRKTLLRKVNVVEPQRSLASTAVAEWLSHKGAERYAPAVIASFEQVGYAPGEWVTELNDMSANGELQGFIEAVSITYAASESTLPHGEELETQSLSDEEPPPPPPVPAEAERQPPVDDGKAAASADVVAWLRGKGAEQYAPAVIAAFDRAEYAPREWVTELADMSAGGELEGFIEAVSAHYTETVAASAGDEIVALHTKTVTDKLSAVPLFAAVAQPGSDFMQELSLELQPHSLPAQSILIQRGDIGNEMYFLTSGEVEVLLSLDKPSVAQLSPGASFGETALISDEPRNAYIRAVSDVEYYSLSKVGLQKTLARFPEVDDALQEDAWQKKSQLSLAETEQTDEVTYTPEEADERQHITLQKGPGGFGMQIDRDGVVQTVAESKAAGQAGVEVGRRISAVNGHATKNKSEIVSVLSDSSKCPSRSVVFTFEASPVPELHPDLYGDNVAAPAVGEPAGSEAAIAPSHSADVTVTFTELGPLGITFGAGSNTPNGEATTPPLIKALKPGGMAQACGQLREKLFLLKVNGERVESYSSAISAIKGAGRPLTLVFAADYRAAEEEERLLAELAQLEEPPESSSEEDEEDSSDPTEQPASVFLSPFLDVAEQVAQIKRVRQLLQARRVVAGTLRRASADDSAWKSEAF